MVLERVVGFSLEDWFKGFLVGSEGKFGELGILVWLG